MKAILLIVLSSVFLAGAGCLSTAKSARPKESNVSPQVLDKVDPESRSPAAPASPPVPLPVRFVPGSDRLYSVGDTFAARRETDPAPVILTRAARRLIVGDGIEQPLSYQPALLDKELVEELARSREINGQNRAAISVLMTQTSKLVDATKEGNRLNAELGEKLVAQIKYSKELEIRLAAAKEAEAKKDGK